MVDATIAWSALEVLFYAVACAVVGRLVYLFGPRRPDLLAYAGMPLVGAFLLALELAVYGIVHVPWGLPELLGPWLLLAVVRFRALRSALADDRAAVVAAWRLREGLDTFGSVLVGLALAVAAVYFLFLLTQPLLGYDALAMWAYKAKIFYTRQAVDLSQIHGPVIQRHLDYPPIFPLMTDTFYVLAGHLDDLAAKAINLVFLGSGSAVIYAAVRDAAGRGVALMAMFLLVAAPIFETFFFVYYYMGYADYALSIFMLAAAANLYAATSARSAERTVTAVVFASIAAMIKNEGLTFLALLLLSLFAREMVHAVRSRHIPRPRLGWLPAVAALLPVAVWQAFIKAHGWTSELISGHNLATLLPQLVDRQRSIDHFLRSMPAKGNDFGWIFLAVGVAVILLLAARLRNGVAILVVVIGQLVVYDLVFLLAPYDIHYLLGATMDRSISQAAPMVILLLGVSLAPYVDVFPARGLVVEPASGASMAAQRRSR